MGTIINSKPRHPHVETVAAGEGIEITNNGEEGITRIITHNGAQEIALKVNYGLWLNNSKKSK